uniref:ShKT domain-containing protein n=1 Tax=Ditylenchus dipsaci TaxID=166011 RepID=A0A915ENT1_9BILA
MGCSPSMVPPSRLSSQRSLQYPTDHYLNTTTASPTLICRWLTMLFVLLLALPASAFRAKRHAPVEDSIAPPKKHTPVLQMPPQMEQILSAEESKISKATEESGKTVCRDLINICDQFLDLCEIESEQLLHCCKKTCGGCGNNETTTVFPATDTPIIGIGNSAGEDDFPPVPNSSSQQENDNTFANSYENLGDGDQHDSHNLQGQGDSNTWDHQTSSHDAGYSGGGGGGGSGYSGGGGGSDGYSGGGYSSGGSSHTWHSFGGGSSAGGSSSHKSSNGNIGLFNLIGGGGSSHKSNGGEWSNSWSSHKNGGSSTGGGSSYTNRDSFTSGNTGDDSIPSVDTNKDGLMTPGQILPKLWMEQTTKEDQAKYDQETTTPPPDAKLNITNFGGSHIGFRQGGLDDYSTGDDNHKSFEEEGTETHNNNNYGGDSSEQAAEGQHQQDSQAWDNYNTNHTETGSNLDSQENDHHQEQYSQERDGWTDHNETSWSHGSGDTDHKDTSTELNANQNGDHGWNGAQTQHDSQESGNVVGGHTGGNSYGVNYGEKDSPESICPCAIPPGYKLVKIEGGLATILKVRIVITKHTTVIKMTVGMMMVGTLLIFPGILPIITVDQAIVKNGAVHKTDRDMILMMMDLATLLMAQENQATDLEVEMVMIKHTPAIKVTVEMEKDNKKSSYSSEKGGHKGEHDDDWNTANNNNDFGGSGWSNNDGGSGHSLEGGSTQHRQGHGFEDAGPDNTHNISGGSDHGFGGGDESNTEATTLSTDMPNYTPYEKKDDEGDGDGGDTEGEKEENADKKEDDGVDAEGAEDENAEKKYSEGEDAEGAVEEYAEKKLDNGGDAEAAEEENGENKYADEEDAEGAQEENAEKKYYEGGDTGEAEKDYANKKYSDGEDTEGAVEEYANKKEENGGDTEAEDTEKSNVQAYETSWQHNDHDGDEKPEGGDGLDEGDAEAQPYDHSTGNKASVGGKAPTRKEVSVGAVAPTRQKRNAAPSGRKVSVGAVAPTHKRHKQ